MEFNHFGERRHWFIEIDLGTESLRDLAEKFNTYLDYEEEAGVYEVTKPGGEIVPEFVEPHPFPRVIVICPDMHRRAEVRYVIDKLGESAGDLFRVVIDQHFPADLL